MVNGFADYLPLAAHSSTTTSQLEGEMADIFFSGMASSGDALSRTAILIARLEIHPAVGTARIESKDGIEAAERFRHLTPWDLICLI
jgi:hypothetical protein